MSISARRTVLLLVAILLIATESLYFGCQFFAGSLRLQGRRAFLSSEFGLAWGTYERALRWGGDRVDIEKEILALLVFGLHQSEAGIDLDLPLSSPESLSRARTLVARRLYEQPYDARTWARDADLKLYSAQQARRETPIDVSKLSEDPNDNLLDEERAAIRSLLRAASLEPNNHFYHNLLAGLFMEIGAPGEAAAHVRRAVESYPRLAGHIYLNERDVPDVIVAAAIEGFSQAVGRPSFVRRVHIEIDAGRLLMNQGDNAAAITYFERAVADAPELFDSHYRLGVASYRVGDFQRAIEHLLAATELLPAHASSYYHLGRSYRAQGLLSEAIEALTLARQKSPDNLKFRHELGELLEQADRLPEAERQFVAAANMRPGEPAPWIALVSFYVRRQDRPSAFSACSRLLSIEPDNQAYLDRCGSLKRDSP